MDDSHKTSADKLAETDRLIRLGMESQPVGSYTLGAWRESLLRSAFRAFKMKQRLLDDSRSR